MRRSDSSGPTSLREFSKELTTLGTLGLVPGEDKDNAVRE